MPDHALMFHSLTRLLQEQVTHHVATLRSKDCPNIRSAVAHVLTQIMEQEVVSVARCVLC